MSKPIVEPKDTFDQWRVKTNQISNNVGDPDDLNTTDKSSLVAGINEIQGDISTTEGYVGDLADLVTDDQSSIVAGINEVHDETISEASRIEGEFDSEVTRLDGEIDSNDSEITGLNTNIGSLVALTTDDKTSVVNSINEVTRRLLSNYGVSEVSLDFMTSADIVDVFLYDTSQDSDRGKWRFRTQNTSWYNEALNTATRGATREFPAVALIVAETDKVTIYDATDPDCPMWMVFTKGGSWGSATTTLLGDLTVVGNVSKVVAKNGFFSYGNSVSVGLVNFIEDSSRNHWSSNYGEFNGNISERNETLGWKITPTTSKYIVNDVVNDVAMTVLDNAPIDQTTGLPVPTIAVATDGGVSVIDGPAGVGTVVDITTSSGNVFKSCKLKGNRLLAHNSSAKNILVMEIPSADVTNYLLENVYNETTIPSVFQSESYGLPYSYGVEFCDYIAINKIEATAAAELRGLSLLKENPTTPAKGMVAYVTDEYNTGWMHGDIKGAFLADTTEETIGLDTTEELVTNGTFDTDTSGWTLLGSTIWETGRIKIDPASYVGAHQNIQTILGQIYQISFDIEEGTTTGRIYVSNVATASDIININSLATGNYTLTFKALGSSTQVKLATTLSTGTTFFDNISVKPIQNLVENGEFSSNRVWGVGTGWAISGGKATHSSGTAVLQQNWNDAIGKSFRYKVVVSGVTVGTCYFSIFGTGTNEKTITADGTYEGTTTAISASIGYSFTPTTDFDGSIESVEIYELAEQDRSVNANHLQVVGQLTKSPVAAGADLVAYSGFSANNYLEQPYNADLDFGTDDFYVMGWIKRTVSSNVRVILDRRLSSDSVAGIIVFFNNSDLFIGIGGLSPGTTALVLPLNQYSFFCYKRESGTVKAFLNGSFKGSDATLNDTITDTTETIIGRIALFDPAAYPIVDEPIALIRIGKGAPSDDQIHYIYDTEKKLFEENSKCTLDTSPVISALSYDPVTEILSVGTIDGVDEFQDLLRIQHLHSSQNIKALSSFNRKKLTGTTTKTHVFMPATTLLEKFEEVTGALFINDTKENDLGLPSVDDMYLQSDTEGNRSWVAAPTVEDISTLTDNVVLLQADIDAAEGDIDLIEADVSTIQGNITTLQGKVPYKIDSYHDYGSPETGGTVDLDTSEYDTHEITFPSGTLTLTTNDFVIGRTINLILNDAGNCVITWPSGTIWPDGNVPDFTPAGTDRLVFQKTAASEIQVSIAGFNFLTV